MDNAMLDDVRQVVVTTLGIPERAAELTADSPLFGAVPELDSLGVLEVITAIENRFGVSVDDDEIGGEIFETLGALAQFVADKVAAVG